MPTATGELWELVITSALRGQACQNVWHLRSRAGVFTKEQRQASAETLIGIMATCQSNEVAYAPATLKQLTPVILDELLWDPVLSTGGVNQGGIATTLAVVCTKRTGEAGKSKRGRFYLPGVPVGFTTTDVVNSTGMTALQNMAAGMLTAFGDAGTDEIWQIGVYSKALGGTAPYTTGGWRPITSIDIQAILGNQRRRRIGVGI